MLYWKNVARTGCSPLQSRRSYRECSSTTLCVHDGVESRLVCTRDSGLPFRPFDKRFVHDVCTPEPSLSFSISPQVWIAAFAFASRADLVIAFLLFGTVGQVQCFANFRGRCLNSFATSLADLFIDLNCQCDICGRLVEHSLQYACILDGLSSSLCDIAVRISQ